MKITYLEMGLMKIQAETKAESQAVVGISDMIFKFMPDCIANNHGMIKVGKNYFNYCVISDGSITGECHKKHADGHGCDCVKPGIDSNIKKWRKLPWNYEFKKGK